MVMPSKPGVSILAVLCTAVLPAVAAPRPASTISSAQLQSCQGLADEKRLLCYDRIAASALPPPPVVGALDSAPTQPAGGWDAPLADKAVSSTETAEAVTSPRPGGDEKTAAAQAAAQTPPPSILQKNWELRADTRQPAFTLRPYESNYILLGQYANGVNRQPQGANADHTATNAVDYSRTESKFQISVRARAGGGLLLPYDSVWVGYTQSSQWQVWSPSISRPFRATSYQPEAFYIAPAYVKLPGTWALRILGAGFVHQSNGQSDPLSRSWNRVYALAGFDSDTMSLRARIWKRIPESSSQDDNPDITTYMGRADVKLDWHVADGHDLGLTVANNLRRSGKGSVQFDYFFPASQLWGLSRNLRGYIQIFHGYGESITDYNYRRTAIGIGFALKEW